MRIVFVAMLILASYVPSFGAVIRTYTPVDWVYVWSDSFRLSYVQVRVDCEVLDDQLAEVSRISLAYEKSVSDAATALRNNDFVGVATSQGQAAKLLRELTAARSFLEMIRSRPVAGVVPLWPTDLVDAFILEVARIYTGPVVAGYADWFGMGLNNIVAAVPTRIFGVTFDDKTYRFYVTPQLNFSHSTNPDLDSWKRSVGRVRQTFPVALSRGYNVLDSYCGTEPAEGETSCNSEQFYLVLDLTRGQYCAALSGNGGKVLQFDVSFKSELFRGEMSIEYIVGDIRRESPTDASARLEGRNNALNTLFGEFIRDVVGPVQEYRVSDKVLSPFDGGIFDFTPGQTVTMRDRNGNQQNVVVTKLRDALNTANDALTAAGESPSDSELVEYLRKDGLYVGSIVTNAVEEYASKVDFDIVEFNYKTQKSSLKISFLTTYKGIEVAFVKLNENILYANPLFYCHLVTRYCYNG